jgi:hypothetical protein
MVLSAVNDLRARYNKPPLIMDWANEIVWCF